jgi:glycosyltransferase 2 family protein
VTLARGRGQALRLLLGVAISAVFVIATVSRVDLDEVGVALQRVNFAAVAVAIPLVFVELLLRGLRWQRLLGPLAQIPVTRTVAYLAIGYFANSMLPARLGDVARAYLAGRAFGISRLAVLGTVVVERLADGLFILGLVVVLDITVAGGGSLASTATWLAAIAAAGAAVLLVGLVYLRRSGGGRIWGRLRSLVDRVLRGAEALRTPTTFVIVAALTAAAFAPAVAMFALIANAAGLELSLAQAGLIMGGLALSTSIPAAPGSIGTYEFVGLAIMTTLGVNPEIALAVVVLVHLSATLPVALAGLLAAWHLHFRVSEIAQDSEPGRLAQDDLPTAPA